MAEENQVQILEATTNDELKELLKISKCVLVDFYADWCAPCKRLTEYLKQELKDGKYKNVTVVKVNVDTEEEGLKTFVEANEIQGIPRLVGFKGFTKVADVTGFDKVKVTNMLVEMNVMVQ
jgi:thioredoxin-like negative regulator of GroEL